MSLCPCTCEVDYCDQGNVCTIAGESHMTVQWDECVGNLRWMDNQSNLMSALLGWMMGFSCAMKMMNHIK